MSLVPVDLTSCPECGAPTIVQGASQPALFFHGGFGAVEHIDRRFCVECPWCVVASVSSTNPRRLL